ncbi:MAG: DUF6448 family protein [Elusimicrobia bacterium]|jgi:hypothetical protein|nr:DUF6448 family protein [Elusimicrobiota bacterium]
MRVNVLFAVLFALCTVVLVPAGVLAHCDTLDGPVIQDARIALEKGDITPVLKWVKEESEGEIRKVFDKTIKKRSKGAEAKEKAELKFFDTLVKVHREGEGAPYTGLKPAGQVEPIVAKADMAIAEGSVEELAGKIAGHISSAITERFERLMEAKKHMNESVGAGREYVEAYVQFMHFTEAVHKIAMGEAAHHNESEKPESKEGAHKH